MKVRTLYLSGPMARIADDNRRAFATVAARLRESGHKVFDPAAQAVRDPCWHSHDDCAEWVRRNLRIQALGLTQPQRRIWLRDDIWALSLCDGIVMLPGWQKSRGAQAELAWARAVGMDWWIWTIARTKHTLCPDTQQQTPRRRRNRAQPGNDRAGTAPA